MDATSSVFFIPLPFFGIPSFLTVQTHVVMVVVVCELMLSETYIALAVITLVWMPKDSSEEAF